MPSTLPLAAEHLPVAPTHTRDKAQSSSAQQPSPVSQPGQSPPQSTLVSFPLRCPSTHDASVGLNDGNRLGLVEGAALGLPLGAADGLSVGDAVGDVLGAFDGLVEGTALGLELGIVDGLSVGDAVGEIEGSDVGQGEVLMHGQYRRNVLPKPLSAARSHRAAEAAFVFPPMGVSSSGRQ